MKNLKKFLALGLATAMTLSMAACGGSEGTEGSGGGAGTNNPGTTNEGQGGGSNNVTADGTRVITIGTWWEQTFDSDDKLEDSADWLNAQDSEDDDEKTKTENAFNRMIAEMKFNNVPVIEEKYNCEFYWKNLTYNGVIESINTSILAGAPDCDIYLVDAGMGIPAQMNGLAIDLKTVLPADHDLFTTQQNMTYLDMGDGKVCLIKKVQASSQVGDTYPLGFNMQMLEDNNLEDPRDLYARGEWTWDVFVQYMQTLTQDTDGDGQIDQYGYCGYQNETFEQLMMANGANIASGTTQTLDSPEVVEALQLMYDMYNTYNVCYPYDFDGSPSDSMRNQYTQGNVGFFPIAAWIQSGNGDYDWDGSLGGRQLTFDVAYVRWPVGPSGDAATNAGKNDIGGELYIIPAGVKDPETVVGVLYDFWNWYADDTSIRDDKQALNWWYSVTAWEEDLQNQNFEVMNACGAKTTFDLWNSMGVNYDMYGLIRGDVTPAQFVETYKQQVQDGLDVYFGN